MLVDDSVLPLFLEFLQKHDAQNLLNFWLAAETFRLSSRDKNLLAYKSRLKFSTKKELSASNVDVLEIKKNSEDTKQLERLKSVNLQGRSCPRIKSEIFCGLEPYKLVNSSELATDACPMPQSSCEESGRTETSAESNTDNKTSLINKDVSDSSKMRKLTSPNLSEANNRTTGPILPSSRLNGEHGTASDSVSPDMMSLTSSGTLENMPSELLNDMDTVSSEKTLNETHGSVLGCDIQAERNMISTSRNLRASRSEGMEIVQGEVELTRQESTDARETKKMYRQKLHSVGRSRSRFHQSQGSAPVALKAGGWGQHGDSIFLFLT